MATANFYQSGNHGLNVIHTDYEEAVEDTIGNIVAELNAKGYSVDDAKYLLDTPRSFETGLGYLVYNKTGRMVVALLEVAAGYYEAANVNIYTGDELRDYVDDEPVTGNKRDIDSVVRTVKRYTDEYIKTYQFSNGETGYSKKDSVLRG